MAQKWYEKATVQSSLVNASVNIITAVIAIIAIRQTSSYANDQLQQTQVNFEKQMNRDSILNIEQDAVTKRQTNLANLQLKVLQSQYINDSINKTKELEILEKELIIQNKRSNEEEILIEKGLIMSDVKLTKYECDYSQNNIDSLFGYEVDYEYDIENFKVKKEILLNQCLALFDEQKKTEIYTKNIFFTKESALQYMQQKDMRAKYPQIILNKKYDFNFVVENIGKLPIRILKSSIIKTKYINQKEQLVINEPKERNSIIIPAGKKSSFEMIFRIPIETKITEDIQFDFVMKYITHYGEREIRKKIIYSPSQKSFTPFD